ncbi:NADH-quinone oxidoreductase subunit L [Candidatus Bathyarchaeota archaeon]|nr:NADH-quinone oxidoreductase subunit L [Candidatus Bathyarchaeota archaeon]
MNQEILIALTVGVPPLAGFGCLILNNKIARRVIVGLTSLILIGSSLLLYNSGGLHYEPAPIFEILVLVFDLILLTYFLYTGFKYKNILVIGLSILQLFPVLYFEFILHGAEVTPLIIIDNLSLLMSLIISIIGSLVVIYALSYMDEHEEHLHLHGSRQNRFFFFMLLLLGAMNGLVFSNSLYWLYFFWEITTLCSYELIRHDGTEIAIKNSLTALWMNLVGGVAFVAALFIGQLYFHTIAIDKILKLSPNPIVLMLFASLAFAAFTKSAQFPFNKWLQGAMVAPTPVNASLDSGTMVNAGIYLILKIAPPLSNTALGYSIALIGAFTFLISAFLALNERVSKGILAYSTIGNLGLITMCVGINTPLSYTAALTLLVFHSISKGLLFLCVGVVENRVQSTLIEDWEGLLRRLPATSLIMIVAMMSMFLPPFGMLLGKWVAIDALTSSYYISSMLIILIIVLGSAATSVYYIKWLAYLTVLPMDGEKYGNEKVTWPYSISMLSLFGLIVTLGAGISSILNLIILPTLPEDYYSNISLTLLNVDTGVGSFVTYPIWILTIIIIMSGYFIAKKKGGVIKPPYLSGENVADDPTGFRSTADGIVKIETSAQFFEQEYNNDRLIEIAKIIGSIIMMLLFFAVMF